MIGVKVETGTVVVVASVVDVVKMVVGIRVLVDAVPVNELVTLVVDPMELKSDDAKV